MTGKDLDVLVLVGSPREQGRSMRLAKAIEVALAVHGVKPTLWPLASYPVAACYNCGACQRTGVCQVVNDGFGVLARHMESADLMFCVAPVYFAGPSAHLKAALDRCQMFWARKHVLKQDMPPKRPCHLLVVGDGGDPFGTSALETICTSALNCANLRIENNIHRYIGIEPSLDEVSHVVDDALRGIGWLEGEDAR